MKLTVKIFKGDKFYVARVPELGVTTQGKTKEEAKRNLREALQLHFEAMAEYAIHTHVQFHYLILELLPSERIAHMSLALTQLQPLDRQK